MVDQKKDLEERNRKVRFHGRVQFKTIRHVADFSDDEITAGWYRKNDFIRMSDEVAEIAKLLACGKEFHEGEELCIRGLEHLVEEDVADYRAEKMIASIDAVLDEQDEQADEDIYDPDMIAEIYSEIVNPLLREAYLVGLRDAKEGAEAAALIPDMSWDLTGMQVEETKQQKTTTVPHPSSDGPDEAQQTASPSPSQSKKNSLRPSSPTTPVPAAESSDTTPMPSLTVLSQEDGIQAMNTEERDDGSHEEYYDLAMNDVDEEGHMNLNISLNSIGMEVLPEKKAPTPKKKISPEKKAQKAREKIAAAEAAASSSGDSSRGPKSPIRKNLRRKTLDRKRGTELSPFVFRRDGTIKFRNYDIEHRKREQSKQRKDCIKSSMFKFLDDEEDEEDNLAQFLVKPASKGKKSIAASRTKASPKLTSVKAVNGTQKSRLHIQKKDLSANGGWSKVVSEK